MVRISMPNSPAARTVRRNASTPRRWPSPRGKPRSAAQRPLPSMMMATWRGGSTPSLPSPTCGEGEGGGGAAACVTLGEAEASGILCLRLFAVHELARASPQTDEACSGETLSRHSGAHRNRLLPISTHFWCRSRAGPTSAAGREPGIHSHRSGVMDSGLAAAPRNDALTKVDTLAPRVLTRARLEPVL